MGCVYTGYKTNRRKNGFFKVGMTEQSRPTSRLSAYDLHGIFYLSIPKSTKSELLFIESSMRVAVERAGLKLNGNDCFQYLIDPLHKKEQACAIADIALRAACDACERLQLSYKIVSF